MGTFSDSDEEVGRSTNGRNCIVENNEEECFKVQFTTFRVS